MLLNHDILHDKINIEHWEREKNNLYISLNKTVLMNNECILQFHDSNNRSEEKRIVWSIMKCANSSIGLFSINNVSYIQNIESFVIHQIYDHNKDISFAKIFKEDGYIYIILGDSSGWLGIFDYNINNNSTQLKAEFRLTGQFQSPINFAIFSRRNNAIWIATKNNLFLVDAILQIISKSRMEIRLVFNLAFASEFYNLEILDTMLGPGSMLVAHHFNKSSPSTSSISSSNNNNVTNISILTIDTTLAYYYSDMIREGLITSIPSISLTPSFTIPFLSAAVATSIQNTWSVSTIFSTNRHEELLVASFIDPNSVRCSFEYISHNLNENIDINKIQKAFDSGGLFSYSLRLYGNKGTCVVANYETSYIKILNIMIKNGTSIFCHPNMTFEINTNAVYCLHKASREVYQENTTLNLKQESIPEIVWRACLKLNMLHPSRSKILLDELQSIETSFAGTLKDDKLIAFGRIVLLELALSLGLASNVAQYILDSEATDSSYKHFSLVDIRRVYEWAVSNGSNMDSSQAPSLQLSLEHSVYNCCKLYISEYLLQSSNIPKHPKENIFDLNFIRTLAIGLKIVVESLLERKKLAFDSLVFDTKNDAFEVIEEAQLSLQSSINEIKCIIEIISVLIEVMNTSRFNFQYLLLNNSSSSSSSMIDCIDTEYQQVIRNRIIFSSSLNYIPRKLRGGLLWDSLKLLDLETNWDSAFLLHNNDLDRLELNLTNVFFSPLSKLRNQPKSPSDSNKETTNLQLSTNTQRSLYSNNQTVSHSIVLYLLIDFFYLSYVSKETTTKTTYFLMIDLKRFVHRIGTAFNLTLKISLGILALWQIDASVEVSNAMKLICNSETSVHEDTEMLYAVIKRLLSSNHLSDCRSLLCYLSCLQHPIIYSELGILARAAAISRVELWQIIWLESKSYCLKTKNSIQPKTNIETEVNNYSKLCNEIIWLIAHWALINGELSKLLECVLSVEEKKQLELFLVSIAKEDLNRRYLSSPAIDLCVSFLLRESKYYEAEQLHREHAIICQSDTKLSSDTLLNLNARETLIEAHSSIPIIAISNFTIR